MSQPAPNAPASSTEFKERRNVGQTATPPGVERRQFSNGHDGLSPEARELAIAIDNYKIQNRRRFITYDEILMVLQQLGYSK